MDEYNIIVTNHALRSFAEIKDYIAIELVNRNKEACRESFKIQID